MRIFSGFSRLLASLDGLTATIADLVDAQREVAPSTARLDALELERHKWEARCEGLLLQAEGKHKAAMNAEARERQLKKSYEKLIEEYGPDGVPGAETDPVLPHDAEGRETERLPAVPLALAPSNKALALRAKWA